MQHRTDIRIGLPSKGRLQIDTLQFLKECGLPVYKPNERQYIASIPSAPGLRVIFQNVGDIVGGVRDGGLDFGIVGQDTIAEREGDSGNVLPLYGNFGFGHCALEIAVPLAWQVQNLGELGDRLRTLPGLPRVATKYPVLTSRFFAQHQLPPCQIVHVDGTLEIAPAIGYADFIVDLVSSGQTLFDNQMKTISGGRLLQSQVALVGNRRSLSQRPEVLAIARQLLEFIEAHARAEGCYHLIANVCGDLAAAVAQRILHETDFAGLSGPTVAPVFDRAGVGNVFAVSLAVPKNCIGEAVTQLRAVGASGLITTPVRYIFEEQPESYRQLVKTLALGA